ncbi:prolipoprotein diacylglyceryl transferase [Marinobacter santoriniensis NKSG1]|uniref:Phosphatidylglycerol--prolipoprotein diacylglyceryl transferase n=1 Tax=Marinobacter santoriniensis NKSG1 TaxID=1288826 RepID=M7CZ45_9GAMM|nr:prolipoprotein diacylglyceryl transferase [Marinobacter santoriniensis]EMP57530.1 prolipoprotein diacylglyceryl transferase [Marinobacter santoriniensis NKSG1]
MIKYPQFDPIAVSLGPLKIHWYGLMYLLGFLAGWWLGRLRTRKPWSPINEEQMGDLLFYLALGVILGGRVGYVLFYNFDLFLADPLWLFRVWEGGMSFHGGLLGVMLAMWWYGRKVDAGFWRIADFVAPLVPIGLGAGRIGNFINGELWGKPTDVPWAMVFPKAPDALARHPSQLYQFALEGVALFLILWWFSAKPRPRMAVSGLFLLCYGIFRFLVEFVRQPDPQLGYLAFNWLTMGQVLSAPMILAGAILIAIAYRRHSA